MADEPMPNEEPQAEAPKMSAEEASAKLASGEIDVSQVSLDEFMAGVQQEDLEGEAPKEPPVEEPQAAPEPQAQPQTPPPAEPQPERPRYKTIGEGMAKASEVLGEKVSDFHGLIEKAQRQKSELSSKDTAISRWKSDAVTNKARADSLEAEIKSLKEQFESLKSAPAPQKAEEKAEFEWYNEPEIDAPDELADTSEILKYNQKAVERIQRINAKRQEQQTKRFQEELDKRDKTSAERLEAAEKAAAEKAAAERQKEKMARYQTETMKAAQEFVKSHNEFDFGDNSTVTQKNAEYGQLLQTEAYIKSKMPAYNQRDLIGDYINGVPDAVSLFTQYGVSIPHGTHQMKILVELEGIAKKHSLHTDAGAPDFSAAYAIKKARDGADIDELNQAVMHGVNMVTEVASARQAAPPSIAANEAAVEEPHRVASVQQLSQQLTELAAKQSTMSDADYQAVHDRIVADMAKHGLQIVDQKG